ncbi:MAG TPA: ferritin-like protein [Allosphingosinicella sp.]
MSDSRPAAALPPHIQNIEQLREHLQAAIELEHSTIPPYLCGLYTIRQDAIRLDIDPPGPNLMAAEIIRTVVVEEMLHMMLASNVLNAVGGAPSIDHSKFVPAYPATLPIGTGKPLVVNLLKFSEEAIDTFLAIERPLPPPPVKVATRRLRALAPVPVPPGQLVDMVRRGELYGSIGEFYAAIELGLQGLEARARAQGGTIFIGSPDRQITREYYYNSGGEAFPVTDLESALTALREIVDQGEGYDNGIFDDDFQEFGQQKSLAHYYRFNQIKLGRTYVQGDTPKSGPSGPPIPISYAPEAVYDMIPNPSLDRLPEGAVRDGGLAFSRIYTELLRMIDRAVNGEPEQLVPAVVQMFTLKDSAIDLIRNPLPEGHNAGPCFEYSGEQE